MHAVHQAFVISLSIILAPNSAKRVIARRTSQKLSAQHFCPRIRVHPRSGVRVRLARGEQFSLENGKNPPKSETL